jgi:hypothetical protein
MAGTLGGWIEDERNLAVYGNARVFGNAWVSGDAQVYGNAKVFGDAKVWGAARVSKTLKIATRSDGYTFALLPQKDDTYRISAGCRLFTFAEAEQHWSKTRGGTPLGDETFAILDFFKACIGIKGAAK